MKRVPGNKWLPERDEINLKTSRIFWKMVDSNVKPVMCN